MSAAALVEIGGWWSGVLHPFAGHHLALMLVVAVLAGIATTQGREAWVGPLAFLAGTLVGVAAAAAGLRIPFLDGAGVVGLVVGVTLLLVPPPRMSRVLPLAAVLAGSLHGLAWHLPGGRAGASDGLVRSTTYLLGFVFTTLVLQAFGAIAGTVVGRSRLARRAVAVGAVAATLIAVTA